MTIMFEPKKKANTAELEKKLLTFKSTELRSFESLLKIRPNGTLSKKSVREEKSKLLIID